MAVVRSSANKANKKHRGAGLYRFLPLGAVGGLGAFAVVGGEPLLALLCGAGAVAAGKRLWRGWNEAPREELRSRVQNNLSELGQVAREDRSAAPQMKRLAGLQEGLVESWKLLPEDYAPILFEDFSAIVAEIEGTVVLARRRSALRRHLDGLDRRVIARRIKSLERELAGLEPDSELRGPFENALASRRRELASHDGILDGIGAINAQLENAESLLSSLRGELLSVDAGNAAGSLGGLHEERLEHLREQVSRFRRSLGEVSRTNPGVDEPPAGSHSAATYKLTEQVTVR